MSVQRRDALALVLMPFSERSAQLYTSAIKPACEDAGVTCKRVDEQHFVESIFRRTSDEILAADLIIAEITERRPGTFYEIGYAYAFGRPTVILTEQPTDVPLDLRQYPLIAYDDDLVFLRSELARRVTALLQVRTSETAKVTLFPWPQLIRRGLTILAAAQELFKRCHGDTAEFLAALPGLAATFGARGASEIQLSLVSAERKLLFHDHAPLIGHPAHYVGADGRDIYDDVFRYSHGAVAWLDSISNTPRRPRVRCNIALFEVLAVSGMRLVVELHEELR